MNGGSAIGLTSVGLAGDALLDAGLLSTTSATTSAAAAALAQGILGFVQKAGHICGICVVEFVGFGVVWDWVKRLKLRGPPRR